MPLSPSETASLEIMPASGTFDDVRMRGFASRLSVAEFVQIIDAHARGPERQELVPLDAAVGRVLARPVRSEHPVPRFARAAMDGYAVRGQDTFGASDYNPLTLRVLGQVTPGQRSSTPPLQAGQAVQIMTGAPLPEGADAVLMAEYGTECGAETTHERRVQITRSVSPGQNVGRIGEDLPAGASVFATGRRLRPQDIGLLAALGTDQVRVYARPRVILLITGDELLAPGSEPHTCQVVDSNGPMLEALIARDGGLCVETIRSPDDPQKIAAVLRRDEVDLIITSGGTSVGVEDHLPQLVRELGSLLAHGVNLRPAAPSGFGRIGERLLCLLPGNPVACLAGYEIFARRALCRRGGRSIHWPYPALTCRLTLPLQSTIGRSDYVRLAIEADDGAPNDSVPDDRAPNDDGLHAQTGTPRPPLARPLAVRGASNLSSTTKAEGFTLIPPQIEGLPAGTLLTCWRYDSTPRASSPRQSC